jgi:hypothetical protein
MNESRHRCGLTVKAQQDADRRSGDVNTEITGGSSAKKVTALVAISLMNRDVRHA